jgi:hypothetical protein
MSIRNKGLCNLVRGKPLSVYIFPLIHGLLARREKILSVHANPSLASLIRGVVEDIGGSTLFKSKKFLYLIA